MKVIVSNSSTDASTLNAFPRSAIFILSGSRSVTLATRATCQIIYAVEADNRNVNSIGADATRECQQSKKATINTIHCGLHISFGNKSAVFPE